MENQFQTLRNWTFDILDEIRRDIRSDHLHTDPAFYRTHFGNRPQNRLTSEEIFAAYEKELLGGNREIADWIINRWVFKHGDLYRHFADRLASINPDFDEIQQLTEEQSQFVLEGAEQAFGAIPTFLFSLLNGVVFPEPVLKRLQKAAEGEKASQKEEEKGEAEELHLEKILAAHKREIGRLNDKLAGVQKKYTVDTESLKKQIKILQRKIDGR